MNDVSVIAYFAGDPSLTYQLTQWLEVLEVLDEVQPVGLVVRDPESAALIEARTDLPLFTAGTFAELSELYAGLDAKVVLYCNNQALNFESLVDTRMLHVHINHGESDKQSMASNNAKAYDRVFVAGDAAVQRYLSGLLDFDATRLVRIGRPQLDLPRTPLLAPSPRRTVLYAPTWEGDADYNDYTSVDTLGESIVQAILDVPDVRLVYKPHPKVTTSLTPAVADAHRAHPPDDRRGRAARPGRRSHAGPDRRHPRGDARLRRDHHRRVLGGSRLALPPHGQADLRHRSPRRARLAPAAGPDQPVRGRHRRGQHGVAVRRSSASRLDHDTHHLDRLAMRHHYFDDLHVGDSTVRFHSAVSELVALRDRLVAGDSSAITA